jgi:hypothetical protein
MQSSATTLEEALSDPARKDDLPTLNEEYKAALRQFNEYWTQVGAVFEKWL